MRATAPHVALAVRQRRGGCAHIPDRTEVARLPVSATRWEVALVDIPIVIDGVDTEGMLVVAEEASGLIRGAGSVVRGEALWPVLGPARRVADQSRCALRSVRDRAG
jgi:hypothetical protein